MESWQPQYPYGRFVYVSMVNWHEGGEPYCSTFALSKKGHSHGGWQHQLIEIRIQLSFNWCTSSSMSGKGQTLSFSAWMNHNGTSCFSVNLPTLSRAGQLGRWGRHFYKGFPYQFCFSQITFKSSLKNLDKINESCESVNPHSRTGSICLVTNGSMGSRS